MLVALEVPKHALNLLARAVNIPTVVDGCDVLLAVVAFPAAHGRGAVAKATAAGSHAVARRVLGQWVGIGLPLPQAKAPSTIARLVILFGSDSYCRGSGPFVLRGGGGLRKSAVALPGVHTPSKNLASVSRIQGHIACARLKSGFNGGVIGSKLLRRWPARSKKVTSVSCLRLSLCFPRNGHVAYARRCSSLYNVRD
jgi:hypothetical protein